VPDALSFLLGAWHIDRRIDDHVMGVSGSFAGDGRWAPAGAEPADGAELVYEERGELSFNGHRGPASRSLIYRGRPDGTADVLFADGRYFYHLDPRSGSWLARHDCGRDVYELSARLLQAGSFEERWRVRGPGKDYEIMTTLVRDGEDAC
jgi:Family of unknown function (DUF6314)